MQQYKSTTVKTNFYNQSSHYENYGRFPFQMEAITSQAIIFWIGA